MGLISACFGGRTNAVAPAVSEALATAGGLPAGAAIPPPTAENAELLFSLLTKAQRTELEGAFRQFDLNNNGSIEAHELKTVMRQLGHPMSDAKIMEMISTFDTDQNGQVEWKEFACFMADRWLRQERETDLRLALGMLTEDQESDVIELSKLREMLCVHGEEPLSEAEWAELVKMADPDGTGKVSGEAFKAMPCWETPPEARRAGGGQSSS